MHFSTELFDFYWQRGRTWNQEFWYELFFPKCLIFLSQLLFRCCMNVLLFVIQVIKAAEDCTLQYMNFMNVVFAAQKKVG